VCVECLIGKQSKPILFKVTEPSSIPYRTHPACAKRAANPDPPPVIPLPESIAQVTPSPGPGRGLLTNQDRVLDQKNRVFLSGFFEFCLQPSCKDGLYKIHNGAELTPARKQKMETPMVGWRLGVVHEDVGLAVQRRSFGWKRSVLITHTRVPYKVYNSVPLVLYLKQFHTTGCTS